MNPCSVTAYFGRINDDDDDDINCESYVTCVTLSAMSVAHSTVVGPTCNAALNRPAYQSSVYSNTYGRYVASLANDGSRETDADKDNTPRCAITQSETNPWWAVDLGGPTTVYKVDFTNRAVASLGMCLFSLEFCKFPLLSNSVRSVYGQGD